MIELLLGQPLALIALALGYVLLVIEMFLPGFGFAGISGSVLAILGIVSLNPTLAQALPLVLVYVLLLCIALLLCMRSASRGRFSKSRLVLSEVSGKRKEAQQQSTVHVGMRGIAHTPLRPAGIAEFDGVRLSVESTGDFIKSGSALRVTQVQGKRVVVCASDN